ncbi:MAG: tyrosine--tRNA ligase [Chlamydiae bacterium RIFCSPHIGHO2_12_FULL_49_9]|nr:MAG: tyrosine--tRNA ligase [Chlamydiae bacterium RIFCSPHIGHO2_12_FULL_49_9]
MNNVIDILKKRGLIEQMTHDDLREKASRPIKAYVGFDPTADSLHLGNLVGIVALAWLQKFGHTPVVLLGGATGRVGDPSGKSSERPLLNEKVLEGNVSALGRFFEKILHFSSGPKPVVLNNYDWLGSFSFIDFLRDVGKHFRIGPMLAKESVRARLSSEEGMSFTEFSYQILQAYDFHYLSERHGVSLQMGGSDQWGNITAGIELNRKLGCKTIYGFTFPLLTRSDGKKFGKSEEGAIWLSSDKLSPFQFYQYLFGLPDADVIRLLKMITFVDLEEIDELEKEMKKPGYIPNTAQKRLAEEVTRFVHGKEGLAAALRATEIAAPGSDAKLNAKSLRELGSDIPSATVNYEDAIGQKYVDIAARVGLVPSKSEGVRLIKNGGAYLNNERVADPSFSIGAGDLIDGIYLFFSAGKKKRLLIKVQKNA